MGVGEAKTDAKAIDAASTSSRPSPGSTRPGAAPEVHRRLQAPRGDARRCTSDAPRTRMYEFLDRLASIALPRIRDFRGLDPGSFDGRGNYSIGIREQIIFPEIDYDKVRRSAGSTSRSDLGDDGRARARPSRRLGLPFAAEEGNVLGGRSRSSSSNNGVEAQGAGYTRCNRCGRPRAVYRKFRLCRICLRELARRAPFLA